MGLGDGARRRLAVALGDVLGEGPEVACRVAAFVDGYLRRTPWLAALGLRAVVWGVIWLPLAMIGAPLPVDRLRPGSRARYLERWSSSRTYFLREGFHLLKAVALMGWAEQPAVRARLGLPPVRASAS